MALTDNQKRELMQSRKLSEQKEVRRIIGRKPDSEIHELVFMELKDIAKMEAASSHRAFLFRRIARLRVVKQWQEEDAVHLSTFVA